jgi:HK97 family phage portal protein
VSLWAKRELPQSTPLRAWVQGNSANGVWYGDDAALRLIPVYSAVSLIADSIAIMPVHAYYDGAGGKRQRLDPQPTIVTNPNPNPHLTRIEWLQQGIASYLLRGNAYGLPVTYDDFGYPAKITWLHPDRVRVEDKGANSVYFYNEERITGDLIHIPWFAKPGSAVGISPISQFAANFETTLQAGNFGRNWFRNSSVPTGWLKWMQGPLQPEAADIAKQRFKAAVSGGDIFVSGNDWDWKALAVSPADANFLETIKAGATEIAAIFKVSPEDIGGETGKSLTYSTLEMNQLKLQTRALQPIFTRFEAHMTRVMREGQYAKFNADAIIRTDLKARMEAYQIGLNAGVYLQNDVLDLEDRPHWTKPQMAAWKEMYGNKGGANPANPNGNPSGSQVPTKEGGA